MRAIQTISLLIISNVFMTLAWYGHLQFGKSAFFTKYGMGAIILVSWVIALFEYAVQVPANRLGYSEYGGPFNLWQLKVIQEVITLFVFTFFTLIYFKNETLSWNHIIGFTLLILAVYFIFKK